MLLTNVSNEKVVVLKEFLKTYTIVTFMYKNEQTNYIYKLKFSPTKKVQQIVKS